MSGYSQVFPPTPAFTEANISDLSGKVYIITGATAGVGLALAKILHGLHATVYINARSTAKFDTAVKAIKAENPNSSGILKPFIADLACLRSIKPAVDAFLREEYRLDVLFLNAGVMRPPPGSKTEDGFDLEFGVNCLSPFLLTSLLLPTLTHICSLPHTSARVVWVSSILEMNTPEGGVQLIPSSSYSSPKLNSAKHCHAEVPQPTPSLSPTAWVPKQLKAMDHYKQTKAGMYLLSQEFSYRAQASQQFTVNDGNGGRTFSSPTAKGVLHVSLNPGLMKTELQRTSPAPLRTIMGVVFKEPKYGAYTELYAGLSPDINDGDFVIPWGRKSGLPDHLVTSTKPSAEGKSVAARFYEWCEEQVRPFM